MFVHSTENRYSLCKYHNHPTGMSYVVHLNDNGKTSIHRPLGLGEKTINQKTDTFNYYSIFYSMV